MRPAAESVGVVMCYKVNSVQSTRIRPPRSARIALVRIFSLSILALVLCSCADFKGFHLKRAADDDRDNAGHGYVSGSGGKLMCIFMLLFAVRGFAWLLWLTMFPVAGGLIHLLVVLAVISLIVHLFRGRSA